ncbi:histidine phosphatase super family protein [Mycobacteroides abscessus MAB_082312_2258]|nr:histidine phosphatase super family protein [Mycobacteroides abscessus MAB_082312_2258]
MGVIYLVRHGQAANYSSSPDSPLTSIGQQQAENVGPSSRAADSEASGSCTAG